MCLCVQDPDTYRRERLYVPVTDSALRTYYYPLRHVFTKYSDHSIRLPPGVVRKVLSFEAFHAVSSRWLWSCFAFERPL